MLKIVKYPDSGHSIPLISVLAPANHHDSHFMMPLINLGQAIGLDLKLITADEAYKVPGRRFARSTGVLLLMVDVFNRSRMQPRAYRKPLIYKPTRVF